MKVIHRVTISCKFDKKAFRKLTKLGIEPWASGVPDFSSVRFFDITEDESVWPKVSEIIKRNKLPTVARAEFTRDEILSAEWVRIDPVYFEDDGYSMPHLDGSWRNISFNAGKECPKCGIGIEQTAPIHLKGEPKLKKNDFISIFWTYSIFARPEAFEILNQKDIKGFEPMPAIHHSLRTPLKTIKQLRIIQENSPCIVDDNLVRDNTCCGHIKYHVLIRGIMKFYRDAFNNTTDLIRTHEWFGSGHEAFQLVLASSKFVKLYVENNWKGLYLAPLELI